MKKKVLLMGKSGSGKTSMRSIIFANYIARDTRRLGATIDVEHSHVRLLGNLVNSSFLEFSRGYSDNPTVFVVQQKIRLILQRPILNFAPRGKLTPGLKLSPGGEILCSPLHSYKPGGERRGEHSP
jgi:alpha-D-ribose 1-methylphosphonate 5-triphosphate synthase subunit PhnL